MKKVLVAIQVCMFLSFLAAGQNTLSLETVWSSDDLDVKAIPGFNFMNDGRHYSRLEKQGILEYDLTTGKMTQPILQMADVMDSVDAIEGYTFTHDESRILIYSGKEKIYRRSFLADYQLYERRSEELVSLGNGKIISPDLSPDSKYLAYVQDNNLMVQDMSSLKIAHVTTDGVENEIINGKTDWVYEEEFAFVQAYEWSPNSRYIAFLRFDERDVPEFTMTNYRGGLYPEYQTFKFPKVGAKNSVVTVHLYDAREGKSFEIKLPNREDDYIPRIQWAENGRLYITWINRHQNHIKLYEYEVGDGAIDLFLEEKNPYYLYVQDELTFTDDGKNLIWQSERNGYNHIFLYNMSNKRYKQLTSGEWEVTNIYGVDSKRNKIFFQAAKNNPMNREIYSVDIKSGNIRTLQGDAGWHTADFSSNMKYYVHHYSNANQAPVHVVRSQSGKVIRSIEDNADFPETMEMYGAQELEFFTIPTESGQELNAWRITPPDFDDNAQHPVLMYVYGGPGSQTVENKWSVDFFWYFQYLAQQGYVVVSVDNRGTGGRGQEFKKCTYQQLGKYETIDQIESAQYLAKQSYVDKNRIGIFGWSYGGYMSSSCILKGADVFKGAVAVAPVTSWKWYDSVYTERYMRTVEENPEGYAENSPVNFADKLEGDYMIVHGLGDDNVHFQQTAEMVNALIENKKEFESFFYPNRNHSINDGDTRLHLFKVITKFVNGSLKEKYPQP